MNTKLKLILILTVCGAISACASNSPLNRDLIHQEKIQTVNVTHLDENISIKASSSGLVIGAVAGGLIGGAIGSAVDSNINSGRKKNFASTQESINNFNVNVILKNALEHKLLDGKAFSDSVVIDTGFDQSVKKPYLIPVLTPSIVMSSSYDVVDITLKVTTAQKSPRNTENQHKSTYSSQQLIDNASLESGKEENKQYWIDNPIILKEKIVNGLYDVAEQFADDFNG